MKVNRKKTPNCSLCRWRSKEEVKYNRTKWFNCTAQADNCISDVYNNKACRSLYEEKECKFL